MLGDNNFDAKRKASRCQNSTGSIIKGDITEAALDTRKKVTAFSVLARERCNEVCAHVLNSSL